MEEIWKNIDGYAGLYQISNFGNLKSIKNGNNKLIKLQKYQRYYRNNLWKNGAYKTFSIHRLVAKAFIPNPDNLPEVNHKDEDKTNNNVANLEWCTKSHNCSYGTHIARVIEARNKNGGQNAEKIVLQCDLQGNVIKEWKSLMEAHRNGFCRRGIQAVLTGKIKTYKKSLWILKSNYKKTN